MFFKISFGKKYLKILIILTALLIISVFIHLFSNNNKALNKTKSDLKNDNSIDDFDKYLAIKYENFEFTDENSDNITGFATKIVPNVVHYVVLDNPYMDFNHYLSVKSVLKYQKPKQIIIHCNCDELKGKYWSQLNDSYSSADKQKIIIRRIEKMDTIFGKKLSSVYHISDIVRIEIMKTFGGIFLDNDVFVVKSLDFFRKYEFSIGWPPNESIGTQVLIGHKNARFPRLWYESYRKYRPNRWYYNAGQLPTNDILAKKPSLVHRVIYEFGVHNLVPMLYNDSYPLWQKKFFTIHLLSRHKSYLVPNDRIVYFDENNIKTYNKTFGQMARLVLYDTIDIISH